LIQQNRRPKTVPAPQEQTKIRNFHMKKKTNSQSAFFNLRVLIGLVVFLSGVCLALAGVGAFSKASRQSKQAAPASGGKSSASKSFSHAPSRGGIQYSPADKDGRFVYLIEFTEKGMLHRQTLARGQRFNPNTPQAQTQRDQIIREQANHVQRMATALRRDLNVTHHFLVTQSGIATRLTPEEAQVVRRLPGVKSVERERLYNVTTFRSPTFIGANTIWDGSSVPGGVGTRGEGVIIAMLDTGIDPAHPSFANDATCGHGGGNPKLISFLDCSSTDPSGLCNGPNPTDTNGHGTHTASTAGGNTVGATASPPPEPPPPFTEISGVAPCANIRAYKVCPTNECPDADIQAGMDSVLLHGDVSVMNFSISGGDNPWNDNDRRKLDLVEAGVVVAASAGNTGPGVPDPVGQVNHLGPWVMTVAASTKDGESSGLLSAVGPGSPPPNIQNIAIDRGSASPPGDPLNDFPIRHFTEQDPTMEGCTAASPPFPPGFFNGSVALIHRGTCTFTEKITNAFNAGAAMVVIRNNQPGGLLMDTTGQPNIPAYSIADQATGNDLAAFVDANPTTAIIDFELIPVPGDVLADFSLRGPAPVPFQDLTKPDITGPGVNIYAAFPISLGGYGAISGTSMSSPHAAGSAALVRAVHSGWTVSEVKSALMMTSFNGGTKEDGTTPWDADDVGTGRLDLTKAALAGLVMDETVANYLAANPGTGGDPKTLNVPSVRNMDCSPSCSWTRTVRNTVASPTSWTATGTAITPGFTVDVSPSSFSFTGGLGETQELTITATPNINLTSAVAFGEVVLAVAANGPNGIAIPDERITVAIKGQPGGGGTPTPTPTPGVCPSTITQSASQVIVSGNSVACVDDATGFTTDNSYWRAFNMAAFTGGQQYDTTTISFGIELAESGGGTGQSVIVNLYANNGAPFPGGTRVLIGSAPLTAADQSLTVLSANLTATVPAGTLELVMEVHSPDGVPDGNRFFIGSNASGETGPSYISAVACGIPDPTPFATIGFPDVHVVFNVNGSCPGGTPTPTPTPTATSTASPTVPPRPTPGPSATPPGTPPPRP
jgi:subtilisin family serine protease